MKRVRLETLEVGDNFEIGGMKAVLLHMSVGFEKVYWYIVPKFKSDFPDTDKELRNFYYKKTMNIAPGAMVKKIRKKRGSYESRAVNHILGIRKRKK